jgi:hypothetical protein
MGITRSILDRRLGNKSGRNKNNYLTARDMYRFIYPAHTTFNTPTPAVSIRKFSPCGKYLICFSKQKHSIKVYDYQVPKQGTQVYPHFNDFFSLRYELDVTSGTETLAFDFCLFTIDKKFVLHYSCR